MKQGLLTLIGIIFTYIIIGNVVAKNNIIPDNAIRIRVIANSNSEYDQQIKIKIKEQVENDMYNLLKNTIELQEARELIKISVLKNCADDPRELAGIVSERTGAQIVEVIGKKIVLYKPNKDMKKRKFLTGKSDEKSR